MTEFSRLRMEAGLSIPDAVDALGYCERTIYRWETGESAPRKAALEILKQAARKPRPAGDRFTFIDLFAGIGGLRKGFEPIGGKCVFTSEWDRFSVETYLANHDFHGLTLGIGVIRAIHVFQRFSGDCEEVHHHHQCHSPHK